MGLELELSELAVIRSIRTAAASSADGAAPTLHAGSKGEDAVGTGCVTPTAVVSTTPWPSRGVDVEAGCVTPTPMSAAVVLLQRDVEDDNAGSCVTPTATRGPVTPRRGAVVDVDDAVFVTPTSAASVLRPSMECPPAPRKPARSPVPKRKRCGGGAPAPRPCFFPVPRDLTKVFVARGPADDSSPPQQAAKKMRVHPVG